MSSASDFAASGEDAIKRTLDQPTAQTPSPGTPFFEEFYDIARTLLQIEHGDYHRIALQFPDELLHDSVPISRILKARLGASRDLYIMADTSYGSCCVDEVAASHVDADVVVHFGHACMSQTSRLPVIYVFGRRAIDVELCVSKIVEHIQPTSEDPKDNRSDVMVLKHDVVYCHVAEEIAGRLRTALGSSWDVLCDSMPTRTVPGDTAPPRSYPPTSSAPAPSSTDTDTASTLQNAVDENTPSSAARGVSSADANETAPGGDVVVWIGDESPTLTKILMTSNGRHVISYSPTSCSVQLQSHLTNRLLMRRYALVQKARDADVFGILVGTLGVASYLPLLSHLRTILKRARKKTYTVSVGKLNPSKLANFMEIECWVWVSCSEGMVDSKEFLRPIITPYELEIALQPDASWSGKYVLDFKELLADASDRKHSVAANDDDDDQPVFSPSTGKYRHAKRFGGGDDAVSDFDPTTSALATRNRETAVAKLGESAAAHFLQSRTYQGLEARVGQDAPSVLEQGRSGIARGYADDHLPG